ncbi:hypothetical protein K474DRAFT_1670768, partial [Panus rudis PR-1116 ss-1]
MQRLALKLGSMKGDRVTLVKHRLHNSPSRSLGRLQNASSLSSLSYPYVTPRLSTDGTFDPLVPSIYRSRCGSRRGTKTIESAEYRRPE